MEKKENSYKIEEVEIFHSKGPMTKSTIVESLANEIGIKMLPDVFFGENKIRIKTPSYEIQITPQNCAKMFKISSLEKKKKNFADPLQKVHFYLQNDVKVPKKILWKKEKKEKENIKEEILDQDWTYLNHYRGDIQTKNKIKISSENIRIPNERLTPENKIVFFKDILLYEDDLGDFGYSRIRIRLRVQKDSVFILMRSYSRVDNSEIRAVENRYFIDFNDNYSVIRKYDCLASSWENILEKKFKFDTFFNLDHDQADKVVRFLDNKFSLTEKIEFC